MPPVDEDRAQQLLSELAAIEEDKQAAHFAPESQRTLIERADDIRRELQTMGVVPRPWVD